MLKIEKGYTDTNGVFYPNLLNYNLDEIGDLHSCGELGRSIYNPDDPLQDEDFQISDGVIIYRSPDPNIAYRLYKGWADLWYYKADDQILLSKLLDKQDNVHLTKFPMGVITLNKFPFDYTDNVKNAVVGQVIPCFNNSMEIYKYFQNNMNKEIPTKYYIQMLKILRELCDNDIYYIDIHGRNFLVNLETSIVNLIDFDEQYMRFSNQSYKSVINNLKDLLINLNKLKGISFESDFEKAENFDQLYESINETEHKLLIK